MGTHRVRVRPPISTVGLMLLAVLVGMAAGMCTGAVWSLASPIAEWASPADPWPLANRLMQTATGALLLSVLATTVVVALSTPRIRRAVAAASLVWMVAFLGFRLTDYATPPYQSLALRAPEAVADDLLHGATELLVGSVVAALGATLISVAIHRLLVRPVEQDGSLCWRCAYPTEKSGSSRCPECGTATDTGATRGQWAHRVTHRLAAHRRVVVLFIAIAFVGAIGRIAYVETDYVRFLRAFDPAWPWSDRRNLEPQLAWGVDTAMVGYDLPALDEGPWGWVTIALARPSPFVRSRLTVTIDVAFAARDRPDWFPRFPRASYGGGLAAAFSVEPPPEVRRSIRRDGVSAERLAAWRDRSLQLVDPDGPEVPFTKINGEWWLDWTLLEPETR